MKLYNITYNLEDTSTTLVRKIPSSAGDRENKTIPRVCLADSLEHCLQALGSHYRDLRVGACFLVREVEVDERDINLIDPFILKKDNKVPDALENREYWYLKPIECNVKKAEIIDYDSEFTIAWTCVPIERCRAIISKYSPINVNKYYNSEHLYDVFMAWANEHEKYKEMDAVWDEIVEDPIAQKTAIKNLKVRYL